MDYHTIVTLLIPDIDAFIASPNILDRKVLRIRKRFIGYTIYLISEVYFWVYVSEGYKTPLEVASAFVALRP